MYGSPLDFDAASLLKHNAKLLKGKLNLIKHYRDPYSDKGNGDSNNCYKDHMKDPIKKGDEPCHTN